MSTVALSMIVRNAEASLGACLDSVRGIAGEMVVADTGSTDASVEVARRHGAKVVSIPWENDFARARNLALEAVRSEWVLTLDADEVLDPAAREIIPFLLERPKAAGYLVTIWNYMLSLSDHLWDRPAKPNPGRLKAAADYPAYTDHENVRLFRRLPDIYFVGRVHETVGSRILETGGALERAGFMIHHFGLVADAETRARKNHFYRELGREKIREMPENAQAHFELGLVEFENFHNDAEALNLFARACELNPRLTVAWLFAGLAHVRLGQYRDGLRCLKHAERDRSKAILVAETEGDAHYNLGDFESARRCYRRAREAAGSSASVESKLGLAELRAGRSREGLARLQHAMQREPASAELHDRLILANVWLNRLDEAAEAAERKLGAVKPQPELFLRAASIRAQIGDWLRAAELLRAGLYQFPEAEKLRQALVEVETRKPGVRSQKAEGINQESEVRSQESRSQESEGRRHKAEGRRSQELEVEG